MQINNMQVNDQQVTVTLTGNKHELFDIWYALYNQEAHMRDLNHNAWADQMKSVERIFDQIIDPLFPEKSPVYSS